ncbi:MAG: hypothetical protein PHD95_05760 [Candidatus ainarchaeum sp.]|nr:hypothetical protein [Candidatus ainarchaeum sp.]
MPNKKKILLDGIKKLLALKVPEEEIIANLKDVGIGEKQAKALIDEVRLGKKEELPEEEGSEFEPEEKKIEDSESFGEEGASEEDAQAEALEKNYPEEEKTPEMNKEETVEETENLAEEETQGISKKEIEDNGFEEKEEETMEGSETEAGEPEEEGGEIQEEIEEEEAEVPEEEKEGTGFSEAKEDRAEEKSFSNKKKLAREEKADNADFEKLWEKGILTIVNQRLQEMKGIQGEIESELGKRASEIAKKEIDKVNVLFESQRDLAVETMNAKLGQKTKEIDKMLDAKVLELKEISKSVKGDISKLEKLQQSQKEGLEQINERLAGLDEAKKTLIVEMNSDLIKSKSEIEEFLSSSSKKVQEIEARVNETLELESNIVDSLVKETEAKLASSQSGRENASAKKFEEALDALGIARQGFEQQAREKLLEIDRQLKLLKKQPVQK